MEFTDTNSLPWERLVGFHHEIASRAEQSFFSLNGDADAERWTSLSGFSPADLPGGWTLNIDQFVSSEFRRAVLQNSHQSIFLGGPCFLGHEKSNGQWSARWRPILYREVTIEISDMSVTLVPKQAYWQLSPLLYTAMDRLNIRFEGNGEVAHQLIERADSICKAEDIDVGLAVRLALLRIMPDLEAEISRPVTPRDFETKPSNWVLFAPTQSFSALTRNLNQDYQQLEKRLAENPKDIGGFRLLEPQNAPAENTSLDVRPIVPLNASQYAAVEAALNVQPVTVISGPPGCGKSQVVVSLLLNCWAEGRTVLFASNNNKAVDVVRDRLKRFEDEIDIAIRAGNQQQNMVVPTLKRILQRAQFTSTQPIGHQREALAARERELRSERDALREIIATQIPARIEELFGAALNAYSNHVSLLNSVLSVQREHLEKRTELGLATLGPQEIRSAHAHALQWLDRMEVYLAHDRQANQRRNQIEAEITELTAQCQVQLDVLGVPSSNTNDLQWLVSGHPPSAITEWAATSRAIFEKVSEQALDDVEWNSAYSFWRNADDAQRWLEEAKSFVTPLRDELDLLKPKTDVLDQALSVREEAVFSGTTFGLAEDLDFDVTTPSLWLDRWAEYRTLPRGRWDFLPMSRRREITAGLKTAERQLRSVLPADIWIMIGPLNDGGRERLAPIVSSIRRIAVAHLKWSELAPIRGEVEHRCAAFRRRADELGLDGVPGGWKIAEWFDLLQRTQRRLRLAEEAVNAWRKVASRDAAIADLKQCGARWLEVAAGNPVKENWCLGAGAGLNREMRELAQRQTIDTLRAARSAFYSYSVDGLTHLWEIARSRASEVLELRRESSELPTPLSLLQSWLQERPTPDVTPASTLTGWPTSETLHAWKERHNQVAFWLEGWRDCTEIVVPQLQARAASELDKAIKDLRSATELLPTGDDRLRVTRTLDTLVGSREPWPVESLTQTFHEYRPAAVRARLAGREAEIEALAFTQARTEWQKRLSEDIESVQAIHRLATLYGQQYGQIRQSQGGTFREALRLAPIWITTAQASQSIPLEPDLFDVVVIDEASQCTVTNLLPLVYRGRKLVVIGDENQLPAIPSVQRSEEDLLGRKYDISEHLEAVGHSTVNVFSAAVEALPRRRADVKTLSEHFRSHPQIIGFSNREIYRGTLKLRKEFKNDDGGGIDGGVHRIPVRGLAEHGPHGGSWLNRDEGRRVIEIVKKVREISPHLSIGIVTPFAAQKQWLRAKLEELDLSASIPVDTAYGFQGDERDAIIFSAVAAQGMTDSAVRWIENPPNMINVAITRAREALFVVADFDFCMRQSGILKKLAIYCKDVQLLRDTSPAELSLYSQMLIDGLFPDIHPVVGGHEVDFVLSGTNGIRLAIEVDGRAYHDESKAVDAGIDAALAGHGYRILRVPARDVFETPVEVVHKIKRILLGY